MSLRANPDDLLLSGFTDTGSVNQTITTCWFPLVLAACSWR
jgi:hypothetical protein